MTTRPSPKMSPRVLLSDRTLHTMRWMLISFLPCTYINSSHVCTNVFRLHCVYGNIVTSMLDAIVATTFHHTT
ncbi:hypothetical protein PISMIDRAFT_574069 [Pisolithus microcarpus 441]|uniref:Uncharacterized protein n=1 Tax=Pisolithus microcarpus 441 TaxID=765257 RepID=A0A0C9Y803_9AGAM|nr:hypothetical protein BKA83DRAFT_574069 [Pisolithus microcarpus]KIK20830.1 hypothetical protein PISMIDRAFT_574069 [Pisolithus microcarpus 441]